MSDERLEKRIRNADDERLFYLGEALRRGISIQTLHDWSKIDLFFLYKMEKIVQFEQTLAKSPFHLHKGLEDEKTWILRSNVSEAYGTHQRRKSTLGERKMALCQYIKWLTHVLENSNQIHLIFMAHMN